MNSGELISLFRNETMDTERPYLWSDEEVMVYLNDAYSMLVRFVGGVPDSITPECCEVAYSSGDKNVDIDPAVLRIVRAFNNAGVEISVIENTDAPLVRSAGKVTLLKVGSETGENINFMVLGADQMKANLHPIPTSSGTLRLQVRRLPITEITTDAQELTDLPVIHHFHLVKWMKALAYKKQDAETFDMDKAMVNEQLFLKYADQYVFEVSRLRRKSSNSLRSDQDGKNPMLQTERSRTYDRQSGGNSNNGGQQ